MGLQSADTDYTISCIQSTEHGKVRASSFDVIYTPEKSGIYAITVFCGNIPLNGGHPFKKEVSAGTIKMSCFFFFKEDAYPTCDMCCGFFRTISHFSGAISVICLLQREVDNQI